MKTSLLLLNFELRILAAKAALWLSNWSTGFLERSLDQVGAARERLNLHRKINL